MDEKKKPDGNGWIVKDRRADLEVSINDDGRSVCLGVSDSCDEAQVDIEPKHCRELAADLIEMADWIEGNR